MTAVSWERRSGRVVRWGVHAMTMTMTMTRTLQDQYAQARQVRTLQGHDAARPFYEALLQQNPTDATAATWIAAHPDTISRHLALGIHETCPPSSPPPPPHSFSALTDQFQTWKFTPQGIANHIFASPAPNFHHAERARASSAPLYLQPLRAGSQAPPMPRSALEVCIQLFLLAVCLPKEVCQAYLGDDILDLLQESGSIFCDGREGEGDGSSRSTCMVVPYCHIMPVQVHTQILYLATDLHPNVLSSTAIDDVYGAVMYIGPDSLALLDHWNVHAPTRRRRGREILTLEKSPTSSSRKQDCNTATIVDFGTGSGIQALTMAASLKSMDSENDDAAHVTCVDINPRALQLARFNFAWNGFPEPTLVLGDLQEESGGRYWKGPKDNISNDDAGHLKQSWSDVLGRPSIILANPPFLPVPDQDDDIAQRYGWFSSGGTSGEIILQRIVELASQVLTDETTLERGGTLAIVSEFMNPHTTLLSRLKEWWTTGAGMNAGCTRNDRSGTVAAGKGILFTNKQAMDASTYAARRADSPQEVERWESHLDTEGIVHISPGLLFLQKRTKLPKDKGVSSPLHLETHLLPKTAEGSIWTPTNRQARAFTKEKLAESSFLVPTTQQQ